MKMRKLFAGLLATSIVAAGTSAFAAPIANDAGYDKTAGTYSIVSDLSGYGADQMTILIIPEAAYNAGTINDADILYIDQAAANTENIFKSVGILGGTTLADGNYYVKIGGENIAKDGIIVEKFTITTKEDGQKIIVKWGDITGDEAVDSSDAIAALMNFAGYSETYTVKGNEVVVGEKLGNYKWGDITGDEAVDSSDAIAALMNFAGYAETYTVNGNSIAVGSDVEIEIK